MVDFLHFILIDFPIFNVADCYVTVATAVLLILLLMKVYSDEDLAVLWQKRRSPRWKQHYMVSGGTGGSAD